MVRLAVDDALVAGVGVEGEELAALHAAEAGLAPPRLLGHQPLHQVGLLAAHLADLVHLHRRRLLHTTLLHITH